MVVEMKAKHQAVIPLTKVCHNFFEDIFPKRVPQTEKKGHANKTV
jgi:hypothetical protein